MLADGKPLRPIEWQNRRRIGGCTGPDCGNWGNYGGLCYAHHQQRKAGGPLRSLRAPVTDPCSFPECGRKVAALGLCMAHYRQSRVGGGTLRPVRVPKFRYVDGNGYIRIKEPSHPNADGQGRLFEHVKVMSDLLGRPLWPDENVHHINGVRDDNRPENLQLWCTKQPKGQRIEDKVEWAKEILARYAPEVLLTPGA